MRNGRLPKRIGCRPRRIKSAQPLGPLRRQLQHQRRASFGIRFLFQHHQDRGRVFHRAPETEPHIQRHVAHGFRRNSAQIQRDQTEPAALDQQIRGPKSLIHIPAAHPQQLLQLNAGGLRGMRIERIASINQRAHLGTGGSRRQGRNQKARRPGAGRAADFRQPAARQASSERINFRNAGGNNVGRLAIAIGKGRGSVPGEGRFELRT